MSQQHILPVTVPPALGQEPLEPVCPPTDTQQEQVTQPASLPVPCQEAPSELPREAPLEHGEKHTTPGKGAPAQGCEPQPQELQQQEQHLEQQQHQDSQEQELHPERPLKQLEQHEQEAQQWQQQQEEREHQEAENLAQQPETDKAQREQQLKGQLGPEKQLLDQQLDQELAKSGEQLEKKEERLREPVGQKELKPLEQQEGQLEQPAFVTAPGLGQETYPVQPPQEVLPTVEEQQKKQEV